VQIEIGLARGVVVFERWQAVSEAENCTTFRRFSVPNVGASSSLASETSWPCQRSTQYHSQNG